MCFDVLHGQFLCEKVRVQLGNGMAIAVRAVLVHCKYIILTFKGKET